MATDMGKLQKRKNIIWSIIRKRDASKEDSQGSMIVSCEIMFFRKRMLDHDRNGDVCLNWDDLAEQDFTCRMSEPEYFHYRQNWWISLNKSGDTGGTLTNRSDFKQPSVVYTEPLTPRIWRTTTQAHALLEVPATAIVIEFL